MEVVIRKKDRINYVLNGVCSFYDISREELASYRRNPKKHNRKRLTIKVLYDIADICHREIAEHFTRTSLWAVQQSYSSISDDLAENTYGNKELKQEYKELLKYLGV